MRLALKGGQLLLPLMGAKPMERAPLLGTHPLWIPGPGMPPPPEVLALEVPPAEPLAAAVVVLPVVLPAALAVILEAPTPAAPPAPCSAYQET